MKVKDFYNCFLSSMCDVDLKISAYADFFASLSKETSDKLSFILNEDATSEEINEYGDYVVMLTTTDSEGNEIYSGYTCESLRQALALVLDDDYDEDDTYITVTDITGATRTIQIDELREQMQGITSYNQIGQMTFKALSEDAENAYSIFMQKLSALNLDPDSVSVSMRNMINVIGDKLVKTGAWIGEKVQDLIEFFGMGTAIEGYTPEQIISTNYDITEYTGVKPVSGWAAGTRYIDSTITNVLFGVGKLQVNLSIWFFKKLGSWTSKLYKKGKAYLTHTLSDPVDYVCENSYIGYFNIPCRVRLNAEYDPHSDGTFMGFLEEAVGGSKAGSEFWTSICGCRYRVMRDTTTFGWVTERWMKPLDIYSLYADIKDLDFTKAGDCLTAFNRFQMNNYTLSSKSSELTVYRGLLTTGILQYAVGLVLTQDFDQYTLFTTDFDLSVTSLSAKVSPGFASFSYQMGYLQNWLRYWTEGGVVPSINCSSCWGLITGLDTKTTVSNADFMYLLTGILVSKNGSQHLVNYLTSDSSMFYPDGYILNSNLTNTLTSETNLFPLPQLGFAAMVGCIKQLGSSGNFTMFLPYIRGSDNVFKTNVSVKTDSANIAAAENFFTGVAIATLIIAAVIISSKASKFIRKKAFILQARASQLEWKIGEETNNFPNVHANLIDAYYKHYKKTMTKSKLLSAASGLLVTNLAPTTVGLIAGSTYSGISALVSKDADVKVDLDNLNPKFRSLEDDIDDVSDDIRSVKNLITT